MPEYFLLKSKICALQSNTHAMVYYVANIKSNNNTDQTKEDKTFHCFGLDNFSSCNKL